MTIQEIMKNQGVDDEVIKTILEEMKKNKIFTASEENLDIRFGKLKADHDALTQKDTESQKLIADLQKEMKDNESVQGKIAEYEATIQKQQEELNQAKVESGIKIALLGAGAKKDDLDYLIFKMQNDSEWKPELGDDGKVKGIDNKLKGMKTQFPSQFESSSQKKFEEKKLDKQDDKNTITKEEFRKMGYQQKLKIYNENPELYSQLQGNT